MTELLENAQVLDHQASRVNSDDEVSASADFKPLVTAIIVNWNNLALTIGALESLRAQRSTRLQAIVVDNGSDSQIETLAEISSMFPEVRTIANLRNLGYAGGCNSGIEMAMSTGTDYVLLLNNDVVLDPSAISELVNALDSEPGAAIAGPLVYDAAAPDEIWFGGGRLVGGMRWPVRHEQMGKRSKLDGSERPRKCAWLTGTAMLVRTSSIEKAGMMDPSYFLYFEDVDWCCRLRRAGFQLLLVPRARIWHRVGASSSTHRMAAAYYLERNRLLFIERWGTTVTRLGHWLKIRLRLSAVRVRGRPRNRYELARIQAYNDYLHRRFGPRTGYFYKAASESDAVTSSRAGGN